MGRGRLFAYEASQMGRLESDRKVRSVLMPVMNQRRKT